MHFPWRAIAGGLLIAASTGLLSGTARAACPSHPYTLQNGQTADANQVMANFNNLRDCVNGLPPAFKQGTNPADSPANWMLGRLAYMNQLGMEALAGTPSQSGTATSAYTLDLAGNYNAAMSVSLTANVTVSIANVPTAGRIVRVTLILTQDNTGGRVITWPNAVKWAGGSQPTPDTAANRVNIYSLFTVDGGATWYGQLLLAGAR